MLTESQIRGLKYQADKSRTMIADGDGLYIEVSSTGRKFWRLRMTADGAAKMSTVGEYPEISASAARRKARELKKNAESGIFVRERRTFQAVADEWLTKKVIPARCRTHVESIEQRLNKHILNFIGSKCIDALTPPVVLDVLRRVEEQGKTETAYRVMNIISQVIRYGVALGEAERDFTPDLRGALGARGAVRHFSALTEPEDIAVFMRGIESVPSAITRSALLFNAHTFVRPTELRHAEWAEINLKTAEWVIPSEKMKMRREHIVPLSSQALQILKNIKSYSVSSRYVFPQQRNPEKAMCEATLLCEIKKILVRQGLPEGSMTWHGFRAMASTNLNRMGYSVDCIEQQLAHSRESQVRFIYNRYSYLDERRAMLQAWSNFLEDVTKYAVSRAGIAEIMKNIPRPKNARQGA